MFFQYQGLAEPLLPPAGPDAWGYPAQVPVLRKAMAAVSVFLVAPVLVPPDASQFEYEAQVPVRAAQRQQPEATVFPFLPIGTEAALGYPAQVPVVRRQVQQPQNPCGPFVFEVPFDPALLPRFPAQIPVRRTTMAHLAPVYVGPIEPIPNPPVGEGTRLKVGAPNSAFLRVSVEVRDEGLKIGAPVIAALKIGDPEGGLAG